MKKNKKRKQKFWVSLLFIAASIPLLNPVVQEVINTIDLSNSLSEVKIELALLEEQNALLSELKVKLEDPEYVKSYARATYMLTKDGEQIYYLPQTTEGE